MEIAPNPNLCRVKRQIKSNWFRCFNHKQSWPNLKLAKNYTQINNTFFIKNLTNKDSNLVFKYKYCTYLLTKNWKWRPNTFTYKFNKYLILLISVNQYEIILKLELIEQPDKLYNSLCIVLAYFVRLVW